MIELIGLAGSGKSSSARELHNYNKNIIDEIKFDKINFSILNILFKLFHVFYLTRNQRHIRELIRIHMLLTKVKSLKLTKECQVCLDQGPFFMISKLIVEIPELKNYLFEYLERFFPYFQKIIYLEAPLHILSSRINSREQEHRIKGKLYLDQKNFLKKYLEVFDKVITLCEKNGLEVYRIDSVINNEKEIAILINEQFEKEGELNQKV